MTRAQTTARATGRTKARTGAVLVGHDLRIPVPDGPEDDPAVQQAEDAAVAADPAFRARVARARADFAAGRGIPSEELERYFADHPPRRNRGTGTGERGQILVRLPPALHKRLNDRAKTRGVSLNTLVVELLAKGTANGEAAGD